MSKRVRRWFDAQHDTDRWRNTDAMYRAVVVGVGLIAAGVVSHTLELVLFGAPLLISAVLVRQPSAEEPTVRSPRLPRSSETGRAMAVFEIDAPGVELVAIRAPRPDGKGIGGVHLVPGTVTEVTTELNRANWGEGVDLRPDRLFAGPDALRVYGPILGRERRRTVLPPVRLLPAGPLPPRPSGLVGVHRSPRPGDSTELRDIRAFQPGDRLRRIDWRVSLRASAAAGTDMLHVREHHADADAALVLAIDTRVDVGADVAEWSMSVTGSSFRADGTLDIAVRAAVSLAASYLRQGDRVGLVDLGRPQLSLPVGTGARHLLRLRHQLVVCASAAGWASQPILRPQQAPPGAMVMVLSPFLDDGMVELTATVVRRGTRVLAMDLLPDPLRPDPDDPWGEAVLAVLRLEHSARLDTLREHGIPVLRWGDEVPGMLRELARRRR